MEKTQNSKQFVGASSDSLSEQPQDVRNKRMFDPASIAFDIDSVVADTMTLFLDIARDEFNLDGILYQDITSYNLMECLNIDEPIIKAIGERIMDGGYTATLKPMSGAPEVLNRMGKYHTPILFVTARPYLGPIHEWLTQVLLLDSSDIDVVTTGSFEAKAEVLVSRNITCFVEDRLETCFPLEAAGITPVLFKQPWNRRPHPFLEVGSWAELESLIKMNGDPM